MTHKGLGNDAGKWFLQAGHAVDGCGLRTAGAFVARARSALAPAGPVGGGILAGSNNPGANGLGLIQSGTLESSNVDLTDQFSQLITTQRSFQAGSRLITVSDSVLEDIVNLKRS